MTRVPRYTAKLKFGPGSPCCTARPRRKFWDEIQPGLTTYSANKGMTTGPPPKTFEYHMSLARLETSQTY